MPKKRAHKPVPELWKPINGPVSWKEGEPAKKLISAVKRAEKIFRRREKWLEQFQAYHKETGNPLFAWDAYSHARKFNIEIPGWVLEYFDGVARGLLNSNNQPGDIPLHLGFKPTAGGHGLFLQYETYQIQSTALAFVLNALAKPYTMTVTAACEAAVEEVRDRWGFNVSSETIRRWYFALG